MKSPIGGVEHRREQLRVFSRRARHIGVIAIVTIVVLAGAVPFVAAGAAPQQIDSCTVINEPGTYQLTSDIVDSGEAACIKIRASNVVFDGGGNTIDGRGSGIGILVGAGVGTLENVTVTNTAVTEWHTGIHFLDTMDGAITGNDIRRTTDAGIRLVRSNGNELLDNEVIANTGDGLVVYLSDYNTLANNVAVNNGGGARLGGVGFGIWLSVAHDNVLRDNTVSNNVMNGIQLTQSYRNELVGNTVTENAKQGIIVESSKYSEVRDNTVSNNGRIGIYVSGDADHVTVAGNTVEHNGNDGIYLLQVDNNTVMNNTVDANEGDGVEFDHSNETEMMGNSIYDNADSGIALAGDSGRNHIYNNYFYNDDNVEVEFDYDGTDNDWNATRTAGTNVLGDSVVAGNYWATDTGTGFSQQACTDADFDGVCAEANPLPGGNIDFAPLAPNTLVIQGTGSYATYSFTVDRDLAGRGLTGEDQLGDVTASGAVRAGADSYVFTSEITEISVTGDVVVLVNGEPLDINQPTEPAEPTNTLVVQGSGSYASYSFSVSGDLAGEGLSREDAISGSSATGAVRAGADSYTFTGELSDLHVNGDATVLVNGEEVTTDRSRTLVVQGSGSYASYSFSVSGDLAGEGLSREDAISGSSATGAVRAGADSYTFTGELSDLHVRGDATVLVDGEEVATSQQNTLVVQGSGSYASYSFSVSGDLAGEGLSREDAISGSSATGAVRAGADSYTFTGEITDFVIEGDATVIVNGKEVDPAQL